MLHFKREIKAITNAIAVEWQEPKSISSKGQ